METSHEKDAMQSVMARTLRQAVIQHQASVFDRAEELYQSILQIDPNHPGANHSMGVLFEQRNQAEASLLHFSIALQGDPAQRQYWLSYIDALSRAGRLDTAREVLAFARQHDLDGDDVDALARYLDDDAKLSEDANHQQPLRIVETSSNAGDVHHLVSALESCARGDIYWANEFFYRWLSAGGADAETGEAAGEGIQVQAGNSQFNIHIKHALLSSKLLFLNDFVVDGVFPGAAVALARWLSKMGDHERALSIVKSTLIVHRALGNVRGFMILENQIVAIERHIAGKPVNRALRRYLGDDDGHLLDRTCDFLFERIDIQQTGKAAVCCGHWMPEYDLGNIITDGVTLSDLYNNGLAIAGRRSGLDGSFKYCDLDHCPRIDQDGLATKAAVKGENARLAVDTGQLVFDYPSMMILAFDESCNLSCPSCRCQVISEKGELQTIKEGLITESIMPILKRTKTLHLNAAGELMVSRPLRRLLSKLNRQDFPELRIDIITNGTLFTSKEWEKFPNIHDMVEYVRVSTDAASKDTFEKLRRGGKWEPFMENMRFLAGLRKSGVINHLGFSMTYQIDNFREMADFVDMCHALDPESYVIFEKLEKMALTAEEYAAMAVHHPLHPLHEAFLEITRQPKFKSDLIAADFMGLHAV